MQTKFIAFVGTKGGILKSTLTQCIAFSQAFANKKIAVLESDSQGSLRDWLSERDSKLQRITANVITMAKSTSLKEYIDKLKGEYEFVFLDLPGESEALTDTRTALALADLCLFPLRTYHKDINAFDTNLRPVIAEIIKLRDKKHFKILATFAHHSTDSSKYLQNFDDIKFIDKLKNIHRDRQVYTYFSIGGLTLLEYLENSKKDKTEYAKAKKAVEDIEKIAEEVLSLV